MKFNLISLLEQLSGQFMYGQFMNCPDRDNMNCPDRDKMNCPDRINMNCPDRDSNNAAKCYCQKSSDDSK